MKATRKQLVLIQWKCFSLIAKERYITCANVAEKNYGKWKSLQILFAKAKVSLFLCKVGGGVGGGWVLVSLN